MRLSVVLPAHNEESNLGPVSVRLCEVLDTLDLDSWQIVIVDDGSVDGTWARICELADADGRIRGLRLSRNFGHQIALTAGMMAADGDGVVTMDADGQHPPETLPQLLERAREGHDVVYAVRAEDDSEGWFKVRSARVFYWLLNRMTSLDLPHAGADFRYMSRPTVDAVIAMPERIRFLRGMTRWVGWEQSTIEYVRNVRGEGESKYTLRRMIAFAFDAIVSFSSLPLKIASWLGVAVSALGCLYFLYVVAARLFTDKAVAGWTSVVVAVLILGGAQLACMGVIGQYVGRMYEETKRRPLFLIREDTNSMSPEALASSPTNANAL